MSTLTNVRALSELTSWQAGFFTTAQAKQRGVSPATLTRFTKAGVIERAQRGIYRMTAAPGQDDETECIYTAWLSTDPAKHATDRRQNLEDEAIAAGATAMKLHGDLILQNPTYEFVSSRRRQSANPHIHFRTMQLNPSDITIAKGVPTMTIERAIADLVSQDFDPSNIEEVALDQIRVGATTVDEVISAIASIPPTHHSQVEITRLCASMRNKAKWR